ncbi:probable LRR receptor-like serine/threonine-protein kinase At3g47570 [Salvia splendens]|uniref:probable LRR receptor-like serine/threonine-protein kinase At3g47570 n=1 Tax=Salvia splendens TaxID=180675 RepID=UPI001C25CDF2|nr:probable LRR receptor-like serine/threonine-protein kinase At3g47570 [Salvia splendens]
MGISLPNLEWLYLGYNRLDGPIPSSINDLSKLIMLDLGVNSFIGSIPDFGNLKHSQSIYLHQNHLTADKSQTQELTFLSSLTKCRNLKYLALADISLNGILPASIGDFSSSLQSGIPSSIGGCLSLEHFYLSNNSLEGSIPQSLGSVRNLITIYLSYNNLSGSIPKSLEDLHFLEYFNVSNNKLVGEIPEGGCFGNLSNKSFSNDHALCGLIRFEVPLCIENHHGSRRLKKFMVPSGVLVVTMVVIVILVFTKKCKPKKSPLLPTAISPMTEYRRVSYVELECGTSGISESNLLGKGSFGSVFEATLSDGLKAAVKVFNLQLQGG